MAHNETPGYGVGTPWLGSPSVVSPGPDEYLGSHAGDPGTGTVAAPHGPEQYLGSVWAPASNLATPDAGDVAAVLTPRGNDYVSDRRNNGLGFSDYV